MQNIFSYVMIAFFVAGSVLAVPGVPVRAQQAIQQDSELLDFAHGLFQRGMYELARNEYQRLLAQFPESALRAEAVFGVGESLFFAGQYREAVEAYQNYVQTFSEGEKRTLVLLRLGQCQFNIEAYPEALERLESVDEMRLDGHFLQVLYYYLGQTYRELEQRDNARDFLGNAAVVTPQGQYTANAYLALAEMWREEDKFEAAIADFDKAFTAADTPSAKAFALYKKGETQFLAEDYPAAKETFQTVSETFPDQDIARDAQVNFFRALFKAEAFEELLERYGKLEADQGNVRELFDIHFLAADAHLELEHFDAAEGILQMMKALSDLAAERKIRIDLKLLDVWSRARDFERVVDLADELLDRDRAENGQVVFLKAEALYGIEHYAEAVNVYQTIREEYPNTVFADEALYGMAHAQNAAGNFQAAIELFIAYFENGQDPAKRQESLFNEILIGAKLGLTERAIDLAETYLSSFGEDHRYRKVLFMLGTLYAKITAYEEAIGVFERYLRDYPDDERTQEVLFLLAYNLQLSGRQQEALTYYARITPDYPSTLRYSALKNTALIHFQQDRMSQAAEAFQAVLDQFPENDLEMSVFLWLAEYYLEHKNFASALTVLDRAESKPGNADHRVDIAYFRAEALREQAKWEKALENYEIVLAQEESKGFRGPALIGKGVALRALQQPDAARTALEQAILENAEDGTITMRARFELGRLEYAAGNLDAAAKLFMLVAVLYDDTEYCPAALMQAGEIFEKLNRPREAEKVYREIVDQYPDHTVATQARRRLEEDQHAI